MNTIFKDWGGAIEVNGIQYDSVQNAENALQSLNDTMHVKLLAKRQNANKATVERSNDTVEYEIEVKRYMTQKATPSFDFMQKWNNDNPMPMRIMTGTVEKETRGMVFMKLRGLAKPTITCRCCGKELTNPVSRYYGIGPICLGKLGINLDIDDIDNIKEELVNIEWSGWVIKSAIIRKEEV